MQIIGCDHSCVKKHIGGLEVVENEASIGKVGEREGAKAHELGGVKLGVAMTEGDEMGLKLLEVMEMAAFLKHCLYQIGRAHV